MKDQTLTRCDGVQVTLQQQAYISDCGNQYKALGVTGNEEDCMVSWDIIDTDCDDESNACDWNEFTVRKI